MKKKINKKKYIFFLFVIMIVIFFILLMLLLFNFKLFKFDIQKFFKQRNVSSEPFSIEEIQKIKSTNTLDLLTEKKDTSTLEMNNNELNDKDLMNEAKVNYLENQNGEKKILNNNSFNDSNIASSSQTEAEDNNSEESDKDNFVSQIKILNENSSTELLTKPKDTSTFILKNNELNDKDLIKETQINTSLERKNEEKKILNNDSFNNSNIASSLLTEDNNSEENNKVNFFAQIKILNEIIDNLKKVNEEITNKNEQLEEENLEFIEENLQLLKKYQKLDLSFKQFSHYVFLELNSGIHYGMTKEQVKFLIKKIKKEGESNQLKYGIKKNNKQYHDDFINIIPENSKNKYFKLLNDDKDIVDCLVSLGMIISAAKFLSLVII
ncbi:hypothetical protein [Candidatus Phytoplasma palmae]|uniref:hypothetical protein n=1 Tax=Candidatus Phytoplasma palmae TaxID=85624 RepID=UPI0039906E45